MSGTHFSGTDAETNDLLASFEHFCTCEFDTNHVRTSACPVHVALLGDQRFLDGLLFARRMVARLRCEEWSRDKIALRKRGGQ